MRKLLAALGLSLVAGFAIAQIPAEQVYRNLDTRDGGYYYPVSGEYGDDLALAGTSRTVNSITVHYLASALATPANAAVTVRLYDIDKNGYPGNLLWTSAAQTVLLGEHLLNVAVPGVTVPDNIAVTVQFSGITETTGDLAGLYIHGGNTRYTPNFTPFGPNVGTSNNYFFAYANSAWGAYWFGSTGPVSNFGIAVCCNDLPASVYDNTVNSTGYYMPTSDQVGDRLLLEGPGRIGTTFTLGALGSGLDGNTDTSKYAVIKLYSEDSSGTPTTPYYTSPNITLNTTSNWQNFTLALPYLTLPDDVLFTIQFFGIDQDTQKMGCYLMNPEKSGYSNDSWIKYDPSAGTWGWWWYGGTPAVNFYAYLGTFGAFVNNVTLVEGLPVLGNNLTKLQHVDNTVYKVIRPNIAYLDRHSQITILTKAHATNKSVKEIDIDITSATNNFSNGANDVNTYRVDLLDTTTGKYVTIGTGSWTALNTYASTTFAATTNASNYVDQTTGDIKARVVFARKKVGSSIPANWTVSIDQIAFQAIAADQTGSKIHGPAIALHPSNNVPKTNEMPVAIEAKRLR